MRTISILAAVLALAGCASAPEATQPASHDAAAHATGGQQAAKCGMHAARAEPAASSAAGHASMKHCGHMKAHGVPAKP